MALLLLIVPLLDAPTYIVESFFWNALTNVPLWLLSIPAIIIGFTSTD